MVQRVTDPATINEATEVRDDPALGKTEKELTIGFARADDRASVYSDIGSTSRALLSRDDFELDWARLSDDGETIYAVSGSVPIGALRITPTGRSHSRPSSVIAQHDDPDDWSVSSSQVASNAD